MAALRVLRLPPTHLNHRIHVRILSLRVSHVQIDARFTIVAVARKSAGMKHGWTIQNLTPARHTDERCV